MYVRMRSVASDKSEFHLSQFVFSVFRGLKLDFYRREVEKNGARAMMWSDQEWSEPPFAEKASDCAMSNLRRQLTLKTVFW